MPTAWENTGLHSLISCLTAAALGLHALLGCCWHHSHGCGHEHGLLVTLGWEPEPAEHHDHDCCDSSGTHDKAPLRHDCHAGKCVFLAAKSTGSARPVLPCLLFALPPQSPPLGAVARALATHLDAPPMPAVPLHLAHQVLLI